MNLIATGSQIKGRVVSGLMIAPLNLEGLRAYFNEWQSGVFPELAYQQYDQLQVLVVLDNSLEHVIPIWEILPDINFKY